ncbi:MAG: AAA family ATPase [Acidimicrobiales bacterium]
MLQTEPGEEATSSALLSTRPDDGPEPSFVGRRAELARLGNELSRAFAGRHRLVVVEGEGGIGKTSLVERFAADLRGAVLRASGAEAESGLAWGVVSQLLVDITRWVSAPVRRDLAPAPGSDPLTVGAGLVDRIEQIAARGPVVIVLDDLHWCDPMSATALLFALRRLGSCPVLTVMMVRPPFPGGLGEGWRRLVSERGRLLTLGGLGADELGTLAANLGRPMSPRTAERVRAHTGGHPLWAATVIEELTPDGLEGDEEPLPVPRDLAGTIRARHGALSRPGRTLVAAAAILGERFSVVTCAALAGLDEPASALQEATEAGLIEELPPGPHGPPCYRFPHPLVRSAVYLDMGAARRSHLHARAAGLTPGREALSHLVAATLAPNETVAAELEAAGMAEIDGDELALSQSHLDSSVRLSPQGQHRRRRVLSAMEAHLAAGEPARARAYVDEAVAQGRGPKRDYVLGWLARSEGRIAEAQARLLDAWHALSPGGAGAGGNKVGTDGGELAAKVAVELSALAILRMSAKEAVEFATLASRTSRAPSSTLHLARCLAVVGLALGGDGTEALELAGGAPASEMEIHVLAGRGIARLWTDDLVGSRSDLSVAVARAQAGEALHLVQPQAYLAGACFRLGQMAEAASHAELACDMVDRAGRYWDCVIVHTRAGYVAAATGDFRAAEAHAAVIAQQARRVGGGHPDLAKVRISHATASGVAAALALAKDDPAALLAAAGASAALADTAELATFPMGPVLAEALVGLGRLAEAEDALAAYEVRANALRRRSALAGAARVRGLLCAAGGDHAGARRSLDASLRHARGLPFELGRGHLAYGKAAVAAGDTRSARAQLGAARAIFAGGGALAYVDLVDATLAGLGPLPGDPTDALTPAERVVAALAGKRLTNPEIAERLTVSRKTVEFHLSHVYAKLGVAGRLELARLVEGGAPP